MKRYLICVLVLLSLLLLVSCRSAGEAELSSYYVLSHGEEHAVPFFHFRSEEGVFDCGNGLTMGMGSTGTYRTVGRYIYAETDRLHFVLKRLWNGRLKLVAYQSENVEGYQFQEGDVFKVYTHPEE